MAKKNINNVPVVDAAAKLVGVDGNGEWVTIDGTAIGEAIVKAAAAENTANGIAGTANSALTKAKEAVSTANNAEQSATINNGMLMGAYVYGDSKDTLSMYVGNFINGTYPASTTADINAKTRSLYLSYINPEKEFTLKLFGFETFGSSQRGSLTVAVRNRPKVKIYMDGKYAGYVKPIEELKALGYMYVFQFNVQSGVYYVDCLTNCTFIRQTDTDFPVVLTRTAVSGGSGGGNVAVPEPTGVKPDISLRTVQTAHSSEGGGTKLNEADQLIEVIGDVNVGDVFYLWRLSNGKHKRNKRLILVKSTSSIANYGEIDYPNYIIRFVVRRKSIFSGMTVDYLVSMDDYKETFTRKTKQDTFTIDIKAGTELLQFINKRFMNGKKFRGVGSLTVNKRTFGISKSLDRGSIHRFVLFVNTRSSYNNYMRYIWNL